VKLNLWFTDAEWVPCCELCHSNNYNRWYLHSHKTDDFALTCQVLSILRCHTEHADKLYVPCTGGQDSFDRLYKNTIYPLGNWFNAVHRD